jgi:lipopolysaccharide transport system ATP-binding protein
LRFTGISLQGADGSPLSALECGRDAAVVMEYTANGPIKNASVSVGFYGTHGQFVLFCNNDMVGAAFCELPPRGRLRCVIPRLPLAGGLYTLNLHCDVDGVLADWVQQAYQVSVDAGDFYGTGKAPPAGHGGLLADQRWTCEAQEAHL